MRNDPVSFLGNVFFACALSAKLLGHALTKESQPVSTITAAKPQRYAVTFGTRLVFVNAASESEALSKTRTSLLREHSLHKTEPKPELATADSFAAAARAKPSLRY